MNRRRDLRRLPRSAENGVLAIIPTRGGSTSLPDDGLRQLAGRPLVVHSIDAARASRTVDRVIVSTDDPDVAEISRRHGAEVPVLRPVGLADSDPSDLLIVQHMLRWLEDNESGWRPETVVYLRPSSPLRQPDDIDRAVEILSERPDADSVRSVAESLAGPDPLWSVIDDHWLTRSAVATEATDLTDEGSSRVLRQTGSVDATRWRTIMELDSMTGERIAPLIVDGHCAVDTDAALGRDFAEWLIGTGRVPWAPSASIAPIGLVGASTFRRPKLLVLDFDGVFTDNRVWMNQHGEESVVFDRGDGMGISTLRQAGVDVLVLSTEENPIVAARCSKLRVDCRQGLADKRSALVQWASEHGTDLADIAYLGNDINDLGCFEAAGLAIAVQDAHLDVLGSVDIVLSRPGGAGAVREACDLIMSLSG